ncbi:MAG: type II secretion system GspH family protein [Candidatus Peribacteraceae bacterium]|nr:type II secretion system GspH family protein [Candidatus Peribacteraceae bacterium]
MFRKILNPVRATRGFTLVEAIVALSIFLIIITMVTGLFTDAFASKRKTEVSKMVYEEARIALERIVKEVRKGTIDYEEYWNRFQFQPAETAISVYGLNYGDYARQFFRDSVGDIPATVTRYHENVGINTGSNPLGDASSLAVCDPAVIPAVPDSSGYEQCELYLISADGTEKTILKLIPEVVGDDTEYRLEMLKLPGYDSDADGQIDSWNIDDSTDTSLSKFFDFCSAYDEITHACTTRQFQKIQPDSIKITSLKFYVSPREDPRKAFAEFTDDVQQQPHVTVELTAEPSALRSRGVRGEIPSITLQTTIGGRAQNEVKSLR